MFGSVRDDQGNGSLGLIIVEGVVTAFLELFVERQALDCTMTTASRRYETKRVESTSR